MAEVLFLKSWWVSPPFLLAGCYPGDRDPNEARHKLTRLLGAGIRVFINLQQDHEVGSDGLPFVPYEPLVQDLADSQEVTVECERYPIPDCGVPSPDLMNQILDRIDRVIQRELPVYVHCWGGHGRTATVIGCWLVRHGSTGEEALSKITDLRKHDHLLRDQPAPQVAKQSAMVREWNRHDRPLADEA